MMREIGTVSPVVWPAWCYSGEGQGDGETTGEQQACAAPAVAAIPATKQRGKRRQPAATMNGSTASASPEATNNNNNNNVVKSERLSPNCAVGTNIPDNNSSSSRSATPSSSYPGTPPGIASERVSSPSTASQNKNSDHLMNRNYSDFMRSLAAKYNNSNPNDYFSAPARNGFSVTLDPRFSPFKTDTSEPQLPFVGLMTPLVATTTSPSILKSSTSTSTSTSTTSSTRDDSGEKKPSIEAQQQALYATFASNPFAGGSSPMFPPLIDMSSTQALLSMVRTANAHNASQLENYLKGANNKRAAPSENSPLDLSSASLPTYGKKLRTGKSLGETLYSASRDSLLHIPMVDTLRTTTTKGKRYGSVSPKPPSRVGSSPRLTASATITSVHNRNLPCLSTCGVDRPCSSSEDTQAIGSWSVDDVCNFVTSIDICAEYAQNFREQRIDGSALPLLTEEHLITTLSMKLGPALKLRSTLARRLGHCAICLHCVHCHNTSPGPPTLFPSVTPPSGRPSSTGT